MWAGRCLGRGKGLEQFTLLTSAPPCGTASTKDVTHFNHYKSVRYKLLQYLKSDIQAPVDLAIEHITLILAIKSKTSSYVHIILYATLATQT